MNWSRYQEYKSFHLSTFSSFSLYPIHLHSPYTFIPHTHSFPIHIYSPYTFISHTHSLPIHLDSQYTFIPNTPLFPILLHSPYTFIPHTLSFPIHLHSSYTFIFFSFNGMFILRWEGEGLFSGRRRNTGSQEKDYSPRGRIRKVIFKASVTQKTVK